MPCKFQLQTVFTPAMKAFQHSMARIVILALYLPHIFPANAQPNHDFAQVCYGDPLPKLAPSQENRTIPWGHPSILNSNGTPSCCSSLDEVRAGIDAVDARILELLSQRAAFVREATRFKASRDVVDVPSRDQQVIDEASQNATQFHLPQTIARAVFTAVINASVPFELCVFNSFHDRLH
ncbi:hypothetical protein GALMADRAFT_435941 [Galerina marginata CBS 339.88]|uniref:Chorismate mutase domain-containing protein n=1 Tax=Galerina marginata (strain CBS 339.88) TaxID=685588 RepID=A0A067TBD1_GALM3|nr:hypothetical protein GALMADRAFT_435941 [Galerina marginata CBS 339.88]